MSGKPSDIACSRESAGKNLRDLGVHTVPQYSADCHDIVFGQKQQTIFKVLTLWSSQTLDLFFIKKVCAFDHYFALRRDCLPAFIRTDHWNFVRRGVDAVVMEAGKDLVNPDKPNKYPQASWCHKPNDEYLEDWDTEGTIANVNHMFSVGLSLANL